MVLQVLRAWLVDRPVRRATTFLAALLPGLLLLGAGYDRRWAGDDGLINLRVVHQLMAGNGFVYNAGERTEVVTSAGWVLLLWLVGELGFDLEHATWVLSLGLSFVGVALAALATARLDADVEEGESIVLPVGALAYAAIPVAWEYATSALENGLTVGFLGTAYFLVARVVTADARRARYAAAAFCGLAPLVRPDLALFAAPLLLILLVVTQGLRARVLLALSGALPALAYEVFRLGYFACLVPNTALAKEAFASHWQQGFWYLEDVVGTYRLIYPLLAVLFALVLLTRKLVRARHHARALVALSMAGAGTLHVLYIVRVGGDFMHGRLLLPGLFGIFASVAVIRVRNPFMRSESRLPMLFGVLSWALAAGSIGWAVYCASSLRITMLDHGINDERRYYVESSGVPHPTRAVHYRQHVFYAGPYSVRGRVAARCPQGEAAMEDAARVACPRLALPDGTEGVLTDVQPDVLLPLEPTSTAPFVLGVLGFRPLGIAGLAVGLRMNVVDGFGLADVIGSRMELVHRGRPGHEKFLPTPWFAGKYLAEGVTQDERAVTARRVLRCGLLGELHAATHEPLTVGRFFRNMRFAFAFHGLRIPADPSEAERKFCL